MTRQEFIALMVANMSDLPQEERDAAIEFYDSYIADAGEENEQQVISQLGSPQKLAAEIKKETKQVPPVYFGNDNIPKAPQPPAYTRSKTYQKIGDSTPHQPVYRQRNTLLFVIIAVLTFPIWFPVIVSVFSVVFSLLITFASLAAGSVVCGVALMIAGIAIIVFNLIAMVTTNVLSGVLGLFLGLAVSGIALLLFCLGIVFFTKVVPTVFRWTTNFISFCLNRKRGVYA